MPKAVPPLTTSCSSASARHGDDLAGTARRLVALQCPEEVHPQRVEVGRTLADPRAGVSLAGPDRHSDGRRPDLEGAAVVHHHRCRDVGSDHGLPSTFLGVRGQRSGPGRRDGHRTGPDQVRLPASSAGGTFQRIS